MIDREPDVVFIEKWDKSDAYVVRKLGSRRWNAEKCHLREKRNHFHMSLCEYASLRTPIYKKSFFNETIVQTFDSVFK